MVFKIGQVKDLVVTDKEVFDLLYEVYVKAGYTTPSIAQDVFNPHRVKNRGFVFASVEEYCNELAGMVIVVPPDSDAVVRAEENECEMHLLCVDPKYRGQGLGRKLVTTALEFAADNKWLKMILWTQKPMKEAQSLYESIGFLRNGEMTKNGIDFLIYEKNLI